MVSDLTGNSYFIDLFEKDISLLGVECIASDGKLLGFIKDIGIETATGMIQVLKITSDSGFLSPYHAIIPFAAVKEIEKNKVTVSRQYSVEYKKDTPFDEEQNMVFVPLVSREQDLKQLVHDRINAELDKMRGELRERLFQLHEEYFITREKAIIEKALFEKMEGWMDERLEKALSQSAEQTSNYINQAIRSLFASKQIRQLQEDISKSKTEIDSKIQAEADSRHEQISSIQKTIEATIADFQSRIGSESESIIGEIYKGIEERLSAFICEADEKINATIARNSETAESSLNALSKKFEDRISGIVSSLESSKKELRDKTERFDADIRSELESRNKAEKELTAIIDALTSRIDTISSSIEHGYGEMEAFKAEIKETLSKTSETLRVELDSNLSDSEGKLKDGFSNELSSKIESIEKALLDRIESISADSTATAETMTADIDGFSSQLSSVLQQTESLSASIAGIRADTDTSKNTHATSMAEIRLELSALANRLESYASQEELKQTAASSDSLLRTHIEDIEKKLSGLMDSNVFDDKFSELTGKLSDFESELEKRLQDTASTNYVETFREAVNRKIDAAIAKSLESFADAGRVEVALSAFEKKMHSLEKTVSESIQPASSALDIESVQKIVGDRIKQALSDTSSKDDIEVIVSERIAALLDKSTYDKDKQMLDAEISALKNSLNSPVTSGEDIVSSAGVQTELEQMRTLMIMKLAEAAPMSELTTLRESVHKTVSKFMEDMESRLDDIANAAHIDVDEDGTTGKISTYDLQEQIVDLRNDVKNMTSSITKTLSSRFESIEDNWKSADSMLTEMMEEIGSSTSMSEEARTRVSELTGAVRNIEETIKKLRSDAQANLREQGLLKPDASPDGSVTTIVDTTGSSEDIIRQQLDHIEKRIDEISVSAAENGEYQDAFDKLDSRISSLSELYATVDSGVSEIKRILSEKNAENKVEAEAEFARMREAIDELVRFRELAEKRIEESLSSIETGIPVSVTEPDITSIKEALHGYETEIAGIKEKISLLSSARQVAPASAEAPAAEGAKRVEDMMASRLSGFVTREEALQMQDDVVQDAIIQIDARFAGVVTKADIELLKESLRSQLKTKMDSLRDFVFDALEGKIDELKSAMDAARIERMIEENVRRRIDEMGMQK